MKTIIREISPLGPGDCFSVSVHNCKDFNLSLHNHSTIEIALITGARGITRIIGSHEEVVASDCELIMIASNLAHGWQSAVALPVSLSETVIHFDPELLSDKFLNRTPLKGIKQMLIDLSRGLVFGQAAVKEIAPCIRKLARSDSFGSVIELLSILYRLSSSHYRQIIPEDQTCKVVPIGGSKIEEIYAYMTTHYRSRLTPGQVAAATAVQPELLGKIIRAGTGYNFVESLNNIRLKKVTRMLTDTTHSVAEVAFACGFNSLANFNRLFRKSVGCTPIEYRQNYYEYRTAK